MFDWLLNQYKDAPEFWQRYVVKFSQKPTRFVVLRTYYSGKNPEKDVLFSLGALGIQNNQIVLADNFEIMLYQYKYLHEQGLSNDFIVESQSPKKHEPQAIEDFINFLGNATLVGYRVHVDFDLINHALAKLGAGRLKNDALDLEIMYRKWKDTDTHFSFQDLMAEHKLPVDESISMAEETYHMALVFLTLKQKLGIR